MNEIRAAYCAIGLHIGEILLRSDDLSGPTENTPCLIVMLLQMARAKKWGPIKEKEKQPKAVCFQI